MDFNVSIANGTCPVPVPFIGRYVVNMVTPALALVTAVALRSLCRRPLSKAQVEDKFQKEMQKVSGKVEGVLNESVYLRKINCIQNAAYFIARCKRAKVLHKELKVLQTSLLSASLATAKVFSEEARSHLNTVCINTLQQFKYNIIFAGKLECILQKEEAFEGLKQEKQYLEALESLQATKALKDQLPDHFKAVWTSI